MPDIPNRAQLEKRIARLLGKYNREQLEKLLDLMGNSPSLTKIPPEFWTESQQALAAELMPFSEQVYVEAAQRVMDISPIGVDWSLVNQRAADYAMREVGELVKKITDNTRRDVGQAVSNYFTQAETIGDLEKALVGMKDRMGRTFGPVRAEMIAVTEVTRAAARGELAIADELKKEGIEMRKVWQTNNDDLVCAICEPLNQKEEGVWRQSAPDGPPAHPRCRCWLSLLLPRPGEEAQEQQNLTAEPYIPPEERTYRGFARLDDATKELDPHYERWLADLNEDERWAIESYTDGNYDRLNAALRTNDYSFLEAKTPTQRALKETYEGLISVINDAPSLPDDISFFRGFESEDLWKAVNDRNLKIGDVIEESQFLSTSASRGKAAEFGSSKNQVLYNIGVPKGTKLAYVNPITEYEEAEAILPPGTKLKILGFGEQRMPSGWTRQIINLILES